MEVDKFEIKEVKATRIDHKHFILDEDYSYCWTMEAHNADDHNQKYPVTTTITVPKGFRWDGASVPKMFWSWGFETDGKHRAAALVHDFIYIHEGKLPEGTMVSSYLDYENVIQHGSFSRLDSDRLFGKMMSQAGVDKTRKKIMTIVVKYFGWIYWSDGPSLIWKSIIAGIALAMLTTIFIIALD